LRPSQRQKVSEVGLHRHPSRGTFVFASESAPRSVESRFTPTSESGYKMGRATVTSKRNAANQQ
jgi:hypothetical protein